MTRRRRRASSAPQRVGSEEGLTSSRPAPEPESAAEPESGSESEVAAGDPRAREGEAPSSGVGGRHTRTKVEQTKDDTDEGWGEPGDDDAAARWLRENRPPHWS
jgi:hypothetical protein